jgi:hypothetical protein
MQYRRTVVRIGPQFPRWFLVERENSACVDWQGALNSSNALKAGRDGKWAEDEDNKLRDAVQRHGGKDWAAISALLGS